jgi:hypothetical protein
MLSRPGSQLGSQVFWPTPVEYYWPRSHCRRYRCISALLAACLNGPSNRFTSSEGPSCGWRLSHAEVASVGWCSQLCGRLLTSVVLVSLTYASSDTACGCAGSGSPGLSHDIARLDCLRGQKRRSLLCALLACWSWSGMVTEPINYTKLSKKITCRSW